MYRRDEGVIVNWLAKVALVLLVLGIVVYEAGVVIYTNFSTAEVASKAADEANFIYHNTRSATEAEEAAREIVAQEGGEFVEFIIDLSAKEVSVTVRKKAVTLFIHKIGPLRKQTDVTATETKPFPT